MYKIIKIIYLETICRDEFIKMQLDYVLVSKYKSEVGVI